MSAPDIVRRKTGTDVAQGQSNNERRVSLERPSSGEKEETPKNKSFQKRALGGPLTTISEGKKAIPHNKLTRQTSAVRRISAKWEAGRISEESEPASFTEVKETLKVSFPILTFTVLTLATLIMRRRCQQPKTILTLLHCKGHKRRRKGEEG